MKRKKNGKWSPNEIDKLKRPRGMRQKTKTLGPKNSLGEELRGGAGGQPPLTGPHPWRKSRGQVGGTFIVLIKGR